MKIYFEVPYGYEQPDCYGNDSSDFIPRKGDYMEVKQRHVIWKCEKLRVQKVVLSNTLDYVTVTLVEEE